MAGLGSVQVNTGVFLSLAGGFIWNRKIQEGGDNYKTQKFTRKDGTEGERKGGQYADLTGKVVACEFKTHDEYGESVNVTVEANGESYIVSISTNNRYSQDMMKALLKMDFSENVYMKPYDFTDAKTKKRVHGISFKQGGVKLEIRNDDAPSKEKEWFGTASRKEMKRFFEDLSDWFVAQVEEKVIPQLSKAVQAPKSGLGTSIESTQVQEEPTAEAEAPVADASKAISPIKMKKALKEYIAENYGDETLPKLSKEDLKVWYELSLDSEELPFPETVGAAEVSDGDLDKEIDALLG
jgi:hypothetical protein